MSDVGGAISSFGTGASNLVNSGLQDIGIGADTANTVAPDIVNSLAGAALGAGTGALTSAITGGNPGQGALIGGGTGGAAGLASSVFGGPTIAPPATGGGGGLSALSAAGPGGDLETGGGANVPGIGGNIGGGAPQVNSDIGPATTAAPPAGLDLPGGSNAASEFSSANPAATAIGQNTAANVPGSASAPVPGGGGTGGTGGTGGANSILSGLTKNPLGALIAAGGLGLDAIKGSQPLPQINPLIGNAQGLTNTGTQLQQAELTGQLPPGAQASVDQAVASAQAAIRSNYAGMGLTGSSAETEALNNAALQGPIMGFQIAQQMAQQGLSDLNLGSQIYQQIMQEQLQSDAQMQQAINNFASAAGGGGSNTIKLASLT